jgi:hypothetical protein
MIPITGTENFLYGISEAFVFGGAIGDALSRSMALAATCEGDLQKLLQLFRTPNVFGSGNRISVNIDPSIAPSAAGRNFGFAAGGNSQILIVPTFAAGLDPDSAARAVFVHEMSEILMNYQQKQNGKWIAGYSHGEALADICSAALHPEGQGGPWSAKWLNGMPAYSPPRPNWIDKTETTDGNPYSFGCGVLFLNYLLFQRGYALDEIIAKGGSTLAETYHNLSGRSDGSAAFGQLMDTYFPFGGNYDPPTDNLFPLPQLASLTIEPDTVFAGETATATVTLTSAHSGIAIRADLSCGGSKFANPPSPPVVWIRQDQTSAHFPITTPSVSVALPPQKVLVSATSGGVMVGATLIVKSPVEAGILKSVTLNPAVVTGGQASNGTVTLENPVGVPTVVGLAAVEVGGPFPRPAGESSVASVKSPATVRAGDTVARFTVDTTQLAPHLTNTVTILAHAVVTKSATLTVEGS